MKYDNAKCNQFVEDMQKAGRDVVHYQGRFHWTGPAVRIDVEDLQSVIRETTVVVQMDSLGKNGRIVYPRASGNLID